MCGIQLHDVCRLMLDGPPLDAVQERSCHFSDPGSLPERSQLKAVKVTVSNPE